MPLFHKIALAFGMIITLYFLLAATAIYRFQDLYSHLDAVVEQRNVKINLMNLMMKAARDRSLTIQWMLLIKDPFLLDEQNLKMSTIVANYNTHRTQLLTLPQQEEELALLKQQQQQTIATGELQNRITRLLMDEQYEQAQTILYQEAVPTQDYALGLMESYITLQNQANRQELARTREGVERARLMMFSLILLGTLVGMAIAVWVIRHLKAEISRRNAIETHLEQRVEERTRQLHHIATHDPLTGLPNRMLFSETLALAITVARSEGRLLALLFMDLDGFKAVNDTFGHEAGDQVLITVAKRLQSQVRGQDMVARLGGDEFVMLVAHPKGREQVHQIATRLIAAIDKPIQMVQQSCCIGLSIGISFYPDDAENADELLTRADDFMYIAKSSGKNCYATIENSPR